MRKLLVLPLVAALLAPLPAYAGPPAAAAAEPALLAEMWVMAGVCRRLPGHAVRLDAMIEAVNARMDSMGETGAEAVQTRRDQLLAAFEEEALATEAATGRERQRREDAHAAALHNRCRSLAADPFARSYFSITR